MTRTLLLIALLLLLPACSESPNPLSPDPEPVQKTIMLTGVLTPETKQPGDARSNFYDFWIIPLPSSIDSTMVTVMLQRGNNCRYEPDVWSLSRGGVMLFENYDVQDYDKYTVYATRVAKVAHNQGESY